MRRILGCALAVALGLIALQTTISCSGGDCKEWDCGTLGVSAKAGTKILFCRSGDYAKVVDAQTGKKFYECKGCEDSYFEQQGKTYCATGSQCRTNGGACGPSKAASVACCSGWCGENGTCELH